MTPRHREFLIDLFGTALRAVDPAVRLPEVLPQPPADGRLVVIGAGKAAAAMSLAAARFYGDRAEGVIVTRHGYGLRDGENTGRIEVLEASHPVPGALSLRAADAIFEKLAGLTAADLVVCLLSGGASALMERPAPGLTLGALRSITSDLLKSGARIGEINTVRKHLSLIKGGRLALAAAPARVETYAISDVPGDMPSLIASGPTVPDPSTCAEALTILRRYEIMVPHPVEEALADGRLETAKPGDARFAAARFHLVGSSSDALAAASKQGREAGYDVLNLGDRVEGEATEIAALHAEYAVSASLSGRPTLILSGGELTVTHGGGASGGPNREYSLALAIALKGRVKAWTFAADTDGIDGTPDAAGAFSAPDTLARAAVAGLDPRAFLTAHDSGGFFKALGDDFVPGPIRNNVSDFRAILVDGAC